MSVPAYLYEQVSFLKLMSSEVEAAREDGWCVECAPECYQGGQYVG